MISSLQENVMPLGLMEADRPAAAASFISTLLNRGLGGVQHEIIVDFNEMVCDKAKRFDLYTNVNVYIEDERITESKWSREIAVSGILENQDGRTRQFHFYLVTWWAPFRVGVSSEDARANRSDFLEKQVAGPCEYVSDAVFEMTLFQENATGNDIYVGHGRGFMVLTKQS